MPRGAAVAPAPRSETDDAPVEGLAVATAPEGFRGACGGGFGGGDGDGCGGRLSAVLEQKGRGLRVTWWVNSLSMTEYLQQFRDSMLVWLWL